MSYGSTGSDQIGDYTFISRYTPVAVGVSYQNTLGLRPLGLSNPYLEWEKVNKLQLGIDLGLFSGSN